MVDPAPIPVLYSTAFADCVGGGQNSLLLLLMHLDRASVTPHLWVPGDGEMAHEAARMGVPVLIAPQTRMRNVFMRNAAVEAYLRKERIAIVHSDDPSTALWCGMHKRRLGVCSVFHARVSDRSFVDCLLSRVSDRVIAVSQAAARRFSCATVIYNAADLSGGVVYPVSRDDGTMHIGYFGRIHPRKGLEYLIDACRGLPWVRLHIFGAGDTRYVQRLEERTSGAPIAWYGFVRDVRDAMALVDCVILPAVEDEGLSRMLIDAMAMGKAVGGTDISANVELLGDTLSFALCAKQRADALAEMLSRIRRRSCAEVGRLARVRAEAALDVRATTRAITEVYREVLR
jgi:glycosyltransferase involved in cell wall biosynthesis